MTTLKDMLGLNHRYLSVGSGFRVQSREYRHMMHTTSLQPHNE